jgi:hypothetical protein
MLNTCKCGGEPVEQTRGEMRPEDHHMQYARHAAAVKFMEEHGVLLPISDFHADANDVQDLGPDNASDVRIACPKCGSATGWDRRDIEEFKNHAPGDNRRHVVVRDGNLQSIRDGWNAANPAA